MCMLGSVVLLSTNLNATFFFVFATRGLAFYAVAAINAEVVVKLGEEAIIAAALGDLQGDARA